MATSRAVAVTVCAAIPLAATEKGAGSSVRSPSGAAARVTVFGVDQPVVVKRRDSPDATVMSLSPEARLTAPARSGDGWADSPTEKVPVPPSVRSTLAGVTESARALSSRTCTATFSVDRPLAENAMVALSSVVSRSRPAAIVTGWGTFQLAPVDTAVSGEVTLTSASPATRATLTATGADGLWARLRLTTAGCPSAVHRLVGDPTSA